MLLELLEWCFGDVPRGDLRFLLSRINQSCCRAGALEIKETQLALRAKPPLFVLPLPTIPLLVTRT